MNIKEYVNSLPTAQTMFLSTLSLKTLFSGVSDLDLEFLKALLGVFGAICYLTTAKECRKQLDLEGNVFVDAKTIKEISELDHVKFLELYVDGLSKFLNDENNSFSIRFTEWMKNEKALDPTDICRALTESMRRTSYSRANPTSPGGGFIPPTNGDRREELERAYIENTFERNLIEDKGMDPNQLASFRNVVDRVVSDIMLIYSEFLHNPSKPVAIQKRLSNFAGKQDRVKLIVTIAKPLPFAFSTHETHTLESTTPRIKLGALKLLCLETIASLGRALELKEYPDAVIDGFTPVIIKNVSATAGQMITNQTVALHWYIPVSAYLGRDERSQCTYPETNNVCVS